MVFIPPRRARFRRRLRRVLRLQDQVSELLANPNACAAAAPAISAWSVGQQVEHIVTVDNAVLDGIDRLAAGDGVAGRPNIRGLILLIGKRIPRGRAKAPQPMHPRGADVEKVVQLAAANRRRLLATEERADSLARIRLARPHPVLGSLNPLQWMGFLGVHESHHLAIVDDILRANPR